MIPPPLAMIHYPVIVVMAASALTLAGVANADEADISKACLRAVEIDTGAVEATATDVQAFPELTPPRVQMNVSYTKIVEPEATAKLLGAKPEKHNQTVTVRCAFDNAAPPYGLTSVTCPGWECSVNDARLSELRVRLEREGL